MKGGLRQPCRAAPSPFAVSAGLNPSREASHGQVRSFIEELLEEELEAALSRERFERGLRSPNGRRHGHQPRQLVATFGPLTLSVPHARLRDEDRRAGMEERLAAGLQAGSPWCPRP